MIIDDIFVVICLNIHYWHLLIVSTFTIDIYWQWQDSETIIIDNWRLLQTNITITVLVLSVISIENCTFIQCTVYICMIIYDCSFTFAFFIKRNHIICQNIFYIHVGLTGFTSIHIHTHTLNTLQNTDSKYESGSVPRGGTYVEVSWNRCMVSAGIIERKLRSTKVRLFTVPCCSIILFS